MKKLLIPLLLAASLTLSGCAAMVNGNYSSSNPHAIITAPMLMPDENTVSVHTPQELRRVLTAFVENHVEYGRLRFSNYPGDAAADLSFACMAVASTTPLGAYGVYYINHSLNRITSYYEADISIMYRLTAEEMASVEAMEAGSFRERLSEAVFSRQSSFAFSLASGLVTEEDLDSALDDIYYSESRLIYRPEGTITAYPDAGEPRIFEVVLTFPYTAQETEELALEIDARAEELLYGIGELKGDEALMYIISALAEHTDFDREREEYGDYSRWLQSYTAYGALQQQRATGEGFAMAMKLLCDRVGIDCTVVTGMLNNVSHGWNIVSLEDGRSYHLDVSVYDPRSGSFPLRTDEEMAVNYRWDTAKYPPCVG